MKIFIKDKKKEYTLNIKSDLITVKELKDQIKNELNITTGKLLLNGKMLSEDKESLIYYDIKEGSTIILIGTHKNIEEKKENTTPTPNLEEKKKDYTSEINNLIQLGYEKEKSEKAINEAEGNISKAIDILLNEEKKFTKNSNEIYQSKNSLNEESYLPKELKKYAIFMKILTLSDPNKMSQILENIKKNNPALLERIKAKEEEFEKFLSAPITDEDLEIYKKNHIAAEALLGQEDESKKGKVEICLSKKESEDIKKLKKLGFGIEDIIDAYLIKDTNYKETEKFLQANKMNDENIKKTITP